MTTPAWVKEQRPNGYGDALDDLSRMLERFPDVSVTITGVYRDRDGWWRVTVQFGRYEAFAPRFEAWDDATTFRLRAIEMATSKEG
jgi:hypothetical protein